MGRDVERRKLRDENIRIFFKKELEKHPKWRTECVIDLVAESFFLSQKTIRCIVRGTGIYDH